MDDRVVLALANPPPAIVQAVFDERQLKAEWDDACADEQDAVSRKQAVLRKALARWPMVPQLHPKSGTPMNRMQYSPEMRRFVRDVLGMADTARGCINKMAPLLLQDTGRNRYTAQYTRRNRATYAIRKAVVELVTKYRLGADAHSCMEALAKFYEGQANAQP